ncbi:MAG: hypothetical protein LBF68_04135 [Christensenellaceae bacterium]|nr:hypothetical protein [Christensenellaceae bacterium]
MSNNLNVIKAKLIVWRVLKVLIYAIGFPLLLHRLKADAGALGAYGVTAGTATTAYDIIFKCFLVMVAVQIIVGIILRKKDFYIRALIVTIVAVIGLVGPIMYMEINIKSDFEKLEAKYSSSDYSFDRYELQVMNYASKASSNASARGNFMSTYNLDGDNGGTEGGNFDKTPRITYKEGDDLPKIFLDGYGGRDHYVFGAEVGGVYSMNGLYADAFVFGFNQARYILTLYNDAKAKAKAENRDIDQELADALAALEKPGSIWTQYQTTYDYQRAYGDAPVRDAPAENDEEKITLDDDKTYDEYWLWAKHYYVTKDRIVELVNKLTSDLNNSAAFSELKAVLNAALSLVGSMLGTEITNALKTLLSNDLSYEAFMDLLNSLQLEIDGAVLTEDGLYELLSTLSYYNSPTTYPIYYFISDPDLRDYAYAKYLGEKHGAFVGSVLIGDSVGHITMDSSGSSPMSATELKTLFEKLDIEDTYMPKYYPWLAIRRTLIKYAGLVPVCIILAYLFAYAERRVFSRLTVLGKGGQK